MEIKGQFFYSICFNYLNELYTLPKRLKPSRQYMRRSKCMDFLSMYVRKMFAHYLHLFYIYVLDYDTRLLSLCLRIMIYQRYTADEK